MTNDVNADKIYILDITDTLDLHTFHPRDVKDLIPNYLDECVARGFTQVRIIHGKGIGVLREIVRAALERHPRVVSYRSGDSWGDTVVLLTRDDEQTEGGDHERGNARSNTADN